MFELCISGSANPRKIIFDRLKLLLVEDQKKENFLKVISKSVKPIQRRKKICWWWTFLTYLNAY